jgi:hypothetical protein
MYLMSLSSWNSSFFVFIAFPNKKVGGKGISILQTSLVKCLVAKRMRLLLNGAITSHLQHLYPQQI